LAERANSDGVAEPELAAAAAAEAAAALSLLISDCCFLAALTGIISSADERKSTSAAPSRNAELTPVPSSTPPKSSRSGVDGLLLACSTSIRGVVGVCAADVVDELLA
jgi:hypothetical protein